VPPLRQLLLRQDFLRDLEALRGPGLPGAAAVGQLGTIPVPYQYASSAFVVAAAARSGRARGRRRPGLRRSGWLREACRGLEFVEPELWA
jgi:hypothetical protein